MAAVALALAFLVPSSLFVSGASPTPGTPAFTNYAAPSGLGTSAGEPSIGVNLATGAVFMQAYSETLKVTFDDSTAPASARWHNVASQLTSIPNVDPILFTDPTTGRTFAGGLEEDCSILAYTDDDGASWTAMPDSCTAPAFDHETIGSGPWHQPPPPVTTYSQAVYYCAQGIIQECAVSWDGGITFNAPAVISTSCTSAVGHVKIAPDGTAYVPAKNCGAAQAVIVSTDNGLTWVTRPITGATLPSGFNDPSVATTPSGWLYATWLGKDGHVRAALSKTQGTSWLPASDLGASLGIKAGSFQTIVAGDDARAAVAFLGTTDAGAPFDRSFTGTWDLYVATTLDAGVTWTTVKATTDPVERGWICTSGTTCPTDTTTFGQPGRNLLDFIGITVDARGRVLVGYADGCIDACAAANGTIAQSQSALATIARQTCGPSLYAAVGEVEIGTTCPAGAPPAPAPIRLTGTYYAHGIAPIGNPDGLIEIVLPGDTLTPVPPTSVAPKVSSSAAIQHGGNGGTIYESHWALSNNGDSLVLNGSTVTAHIWVTAEPRPPATATKFRVALYDQGAGGFANLSRPLATTLVNIEPSLGPQEIIVTFSGLTATLTSGLELWTDNVDGADVQAYYDATSTRTRIEVI